MTKAAVIGTGYIAREHLACLSRLPGVQTVGVCDLSPAMAESTAEMFKVGRWYTDHRRMIEETKPDVVHITTPPNSHTPLTIDVLEAGAHAFVEKPITLTLEEMLDLKSLAASRSKLLIEDYNYLFNSSVQTILNHVRSGALGEVVHVEVMLSLNILGKGSRFADPNSPHPTLKMPGGAIADFLTHLAYLAVAFIGPHRGCRSIWQKRKAGTILPSDEFRSLIEGEKATAMIGFSSHAQPDAFMLRVHGTKMRATASLFEPLLTIEKLRGGARPLMPVFNGVSVAGAYRRSAFGGLWRKLGGRPVAYEGLWVLLDKTYKAVGSGLTPPVSVEMIEAVNRLVHDLTREDLKL